MTASAVSISGTIGWIGLIIPHLGRLTIGSDHTKLLPTTIIWSYIYVDNRHISTNINIFRNSIININRFVGRLPMHIYCIGKELMFLSGIWESF